MPAHEEGARKRLRNEQATQAEGQKPAKRPKAHHKRSLCRSSQHYRFTSLFYDQLPTLRLTRRALEELNRRTNRAEQATAPSSQQITVSPPLRRSSRRQRLQAEPGALLDVQSFLETSNSKQLAALKAFARRGGPDPRDCVVMGRGRSAAPTKASQATGIRKSTTATGRSSSRRSQPSTSHTKSSGPYDGNFEIYLKHAGVMNLWHEDPGTGDEIPEPDNMEAIRERLSRRRPSLSPSTFTAQDFARFHKNASLVDSEAEVMAKVIPTLASGGLPGKCNALSTKFTNLDSLSSTLLDRNGKPATMMPGNPDFWDGNPSMIDLRLRADLNALIVPTKTGVTAVSPNFILAAKGPNGSGLVCLRQARYDGALAARGMHALQTYRLPRDVQTDPGGPYNASVLTCTYTTGLLQIFTITRRYNHQEGRVDYLIHQVGQYALFGTHAAFLEGATAFRNARDWAHQVRQAAMAEATVRLPPPPPRPPNSGAADGMPVVTASSDDVSMTSDDLDPDDLAGPSAGTSISEQTSGRAPTEPRGVSNSGKTNLKRKGRRSR